MAESDSVQCRLCLVTPSGAMAADFSKALGEALDGGDVASLIVTADVAEPTAFAKAIVPIAQANGVAALIVNDTQLAGRSGADGVHIDSGHDELAAAAKSIRPKGIVGAGGFRTRHDAMRAGEVDPDYVFFGRLDGDTDADIFPKSLDLAAWWAGIFQIPAIVMGGASLDSVAAARNAGVEFVALRRAVWDHPDGPRAAVAEANRLMAMTTEPVK